MGSAPSQPQNGCNTPCNPESTDFIQETCSWWLFWCSEKVRRLPIPWELLPKSPPLPPQPPPTPPSGVLHSPSIRRPLHRCPPRAVQDRVHDHPSNLHRRRLRRKHREAPRRRMRTRMVHTRTSRYRLRSRGRFLPDRWLQALRSWQGVLPKSGLQEGRWRRKDILCVCPQPRLFYLLR